jgi:hypothetical protein
MTSHVEASPPQDEVWMERAKQELAGCEKRELEFLANDRQERERELADRLNVDRGTLLRL